MTDRAKLADGRWQMRCKAEGRTPIHRPTPYLNPSSTPHPTPTPLRLPDITSPLVSLRMSSPDNKPAPAAVAVAPSPAATSADDDPPSAAEPVENPPPWKPSASDDITANTAETGGAKEDNEVATSTKKTTPMEVDVSNSNNTLAASTNSTPTATITYTHACFLCCRKFTSLEHLAKHEDKSKLHKTNLEREEALKREKKSDGAGADASDDDDDDDDNSGDDSDSVAAPNKRKNGSSSKRSPKPQQPRRLRSRVGGPVQVWRCSSCNDSYFDTYELAAEHESRCNQRSRRLSSAPNFSSDSEEEAITPKKNLMKRAAKPTSNASSSGADDAEELSPASTGTGGNISGIDDASSEKHEPKRKRRRPRLSDEVRQRREKEKQKQMTERKKKSKKKRRKKRPEDVLLESIADQVPFGLNKSDPKDAFSPLHKLLREATEVFVVRTRYEAVDLTPFGDQTLKVGTVGLRCKFCQDNCVFFPAHVEDIYNKVRRGIQDHISSGVCEDMSPMVKRRFFAVENEGRYTNISTLYRTQAKEVGLYDIGDRNGLGLRGVSTALINANIEGRSSSSNSDIDSDAMSVSSSSMSAEIESDDEIGTLEEEVAARKSADRPACNYPGCDKYKQSRCEGFCIRHYKESLALFDSEKEKEKKKYHIGRSIGICSVEGCTKQTQYKCNGMCHRHHTQSMEESSASDDASGEESSSSSDSDTEHPMVSDLLSREERKIVSPYRLKLLSHLQLCYLSPKDKNHSRKDLPDGMPGMKCIHCNKLKVFAVADTMFKKVSKGKHQKHLTSECKGIHYKQISQLERLEREEEESDRSGAIPKSLRSDIYKRMVERATSEKYLRKKDGKKLLETAKERSERSLRK